MVTGDHVSPRSRNLTKQNPNETCYADQYTPSQMQAESPKEKNLSPPVRVSTWDRLGPTPSLLLFSAG